MPRAQERRGRLARGRLARASARRVGRVGAQPEPVQIAVQEQEAVVRAEGEGVALRSPFAEPERSDWGRDYWAGSNSREPSF